MVWQLVLKFLQELGISFENIQTEFGASPKPPVKWVLGAVFSGGKLARA
jgi:hypothetical protein